MASPRLESASQSTRTESYLRAVALEQVREQYRAVGFRNVAGMTAEQRAEVSLEETAVRMRLGKAVCALEDALRAEAAGKPRRKFYTLFCKWPDEIEPFTVEGPMLLTPEDVRAAIPQHRHVTEVFYGEDDVTEQFITEEASPNYRVKECA